MLVRGVVSAAVVVLSVGVLSGCVPEEVEPTPTPLFATEEEAFAAAEDVYRAYVDALNVDREEARAFLAGRALEADIASSARFEERGWKLQGTIRIVAFKAASLTSMAGIAHIEARVCVDSSMTRLIDDEGHDITPTERADVGTLAVEFVARSKVLLISESNASEVDACV
jgi:hypothetical protein